MFRKLSLFSVVLALILIVLDAYSRYAGWQLACQEWPLCYGQLFIMDDSQLQAGANGLAIGLGLASRYAFGLLALAILGLAVSSGLQTTRRSSAIAISLFLLVCMGLLAYGNVLLVKLQAMPVIVTLNTVIELSVFWLLFALYLRTESSITALGNRFSVWFSRLSMAFLFGQMVIGAWVASNHAGLVCVGFPHCNGQWLPAADYFAALNMLAGLFSGYAGDLAYDLQIAISILHRWGAVLCFAILTILAWGSLAAAKPKSVRTAGLWLSVLLFAEIVLGIAGFKLALPIWVALLHHVVACLLMLPLLAISFYSRYGLESEAGAVAEANLVATVAAFTGDIYVEPEPESLLLRLKNQLQRTRSGLGGLLGSLSLSGKIDRDLLEDLETRLLMADIGINVTNDIIARLTQRLERQQLNDGEALKSALKEELLEILEPCNQPLVIPKNGKPFVILVVGVNGAGKTTTIGKLAKRLQAQGNSVMLAAGDTFRAAAVEQLQTWGERNHIHVVAQHTGADSASVIYDGVQSAQAKGIDVLIADTAGRLHTKSNLMDELKKVKRIMGKLDETAPHEVLLVLDAGTGQNALSQAKLFDETVKLTGLVLTKLDGTAKGGVIFALAKQSAIPIRYIGIGEGIDDLQDFNATHFVDALFAND
jgi:fused signal recognition particle receptor